MTHLDELLDYLPEIELPADDLPGAARTKPGGALLAEQCALLVDCLRSVWVKGQRNQAALAIGGLLAHRGLSHDTAADVLAALVLGSNDTETEARFAALRRSYRRYEAGAPVMGWGWIAEQLPSEKLAVLRLALQGTAVDPSTGEILEPGAEPSPAPPQAAVSKLLFVRGGDLTRMDVPKPDWIWDGNLPAGSLTLLCGDPKSGKSLLAGNLALAQAQARLLHNRCCTGGRVLFLNFEDHLGLTRSRLMQMQDGPIPDDVLVAYDPKTTLQSYLGDLRALIQGEGVSLVVLDPLLRAVTLLDENDNASAERAVRPLQELAEETGAGILVVHHTNKGTQQGGRKVRGASSIFGAVQGALFLVRDPERPEAKLEVVTKYGEPHSYPVTLNPARLIWEREAPVAEALRQDFMARYLRHLQDKPFGLFPTELAQLSGVKLFVVTEHMRELAVQGRVEEVRTSDGQARYRLREEG